MENTMFMTKLNTGLGTDQLINQPITALFNILQKLLI